MRGETVRYEEGRDDAEGYEERKMTRWGSKREGGTV